MDSAKLFAMNLIELRQGDEWATTFIKMIESRDAAILREVADAGEIELFELTKPYREQMAKCQAENDLQGYDHAYRVVQDMGKGGHAYVRVIRKLLMEHAAIVGEGEVSVESAESVAQKTEIGVKYV